jgi:hypothetical protein
MAGVSRESNAGQATECREESTGSNRKENRPAILRSNADENRFPIPSADHAAMGALALMDRSQCAAERGENTIACGSADSSAMSRDESVRHSAKGG